MGPGPAARMAPESDPMHTVECPHCHKRFKVPTPVSGAKMKCSRCGQVFVGSSAQRPDGGAAASASAPAGQPGAPPPEGRPAGYRARQSSNVVMTVIAFFAIAGILALAAALYYRLTHVTFVEVDPETGQRVKKHMSQKQADRQLAAERARAEAARRRRMGLTASGASAAPGQRLPERLWPTSGTATGPAATAPAVTSDPKLSVSKDLVEGGVIREMTFLCGRVLSNYTVPLESVALTAYVNGAKGPAASYRYIPAQGSIRYTLRLGTKAVGEADVQVIARATPNADLLVWAIDATNIRRTAEGEKAILTGWVKNPHDTAVKNVKIHCDAFAADGIQCDRAVGRLTHARTIGAGKSEPFRVEFTRPGTFEILSAIDARAVAERF